MKEELLASYAERTHDGSPELVLLLAQSNEGELTSVFFWFPFLLLFVLWVDEFDPGWFRYDGIDFCASRVVEEVDGEIYRLEQIEGKQVRLFLTSPPTLFDRSRSLLHR